MDEQADILTISQLQKVISLSYRDGTCCKWNIPSLQVIGKATTIPVFMMMEDLPVLGSARRRLPARI